ncbi:hypothetical protein A8H33_26970 [Burkholderia vietnamiensis]|nr:hypothetical protein A8H33_26970 [Burkholderia vietnamiensis]
MRLHFRDGRRADGAGGQGRRGQGVSGRATRGAMALGGVGVVYRVSTGICGMSSYDMVRR